MATNSTLKNQLVNKQQSEVNNVQSTVKGILSMDAYKKRFEEVLQKKAPQYMSSIINLVNSDQNLQNVQPMTVIASCMVAATLDLPVDKNLGYAWIVPYGGKAQFQLGYKGYIQLALRTGQYKAINALPIYEGEMIEWNPLTEKLVIDFTKKESDKIIGYAGYFELINGFKKTVYWTAEQIIKHKNKFSKSDFGWKKDFDAMALKTVIRNMLSKWGILSVEMQQAFTNDDRVATLNKDMETEPEGDDGFIDADFTTVNDDEQEPDYSGTPFEKVE
jgi:recombination protein RecT